MNIPDEVKLENLLREEIEFQFNSIENFSKESGIPVDKLNSVLSSSILSIDLGSADIICDLLCIDLNALAKGVLLPFEDIQ